MPEYAEFLNSKQKFSLPTGFTEVPELNPMLFDFQRDIVAWALQRGRAAVFADCGTGKTPIQLSWANHVPGDVLILAPLAVSAQTVREGAKFGYPVNYCRSQDGMEPGINITNYEMMDHFDPNQWGGIVVDESSILKGFDGSTRKAITEFASHIPFRLACTATPAPNDLIELTNHAEFLDIMSGKEIIALFFTQDGNTTHKWRLKGHAQNDFWQWMASWSVALRKPSDLGYDDRDFILPPLHIHQTTVDVDVSSEFLFPMEALTLQERQAARRDSIDDRVNVCADLVNGNDRPWIVWCNLNNESAALGNAIPDAVEVSGADTREFKEKALLDFIEGKVRVIVTKPRIAGFGMNLQHCADVAFVGLSDSYEQYYQAMRRCWRFGQKKPVNVYVITAETEGAVVANIRRKEILAAETMENIVKHMKGLNLKPAEKEEMAYQEKEVGGKNWKLYLGDCVERIDEIESDSVGMAIFSPPFPSMYVYTNSRRDMGNCAGIDGMIDHFSRLVTADKLLRVMMPGRSVCIHLTQTPAFKGSDGFVGLRDFRGKVISMMQDAGWIYYGEWCIDKDPQVKAVRTKDASLQFKSLATDSSRMRAALADYLLQFRKPGDNPVPIRAGVSEKYKNLDGWITNEEWIEWAAPVWYRACPGYPGGIRETDVLNVSAAREDKDERHLCPLQLGVIKRAVKLCSAPGETVLSPFTGIGSEGHMALQLGRKFVGIELKESYWRQAGRNLERARESLGGLFAEDGCNGGTNGTAASGGG
jgi:DNA modification methylase